MKNGKATTAGTGEKLSISRVG